MSSNGTMLDNAYHELEIVKERIHRAMIDCLPVGCCVTWIVTRNGIEHHQFGEVIRHGYDDTVFVENETTGKLRRLSARQLEFVHSSIDDALEPEVLG